MNKLKKIFPAIFIVLLMNFTILPSIAHAGDHCSDALVECAGMCSDAWVDASTTEEGGVSNPFIALAGLAAMGACGNGCTIGYAACKIFL